MYPRKGIQPSASLPVTRERARAEGAQPDRDRMGGLGFHLEVTDAVVAPVVGIAGVCPGTADDLDGFCQAVDFFGR